MFNLFKKKNSQSENNHEKIVNLKIEGMHCPSCSINIDGELEESVGVLESTTHYAHATTTVKYNPEEISLPQIAAIIKNLGYTAVEK